MSRKENPQPRLDFSRVEQIPEIRGCSYVVTGADTLARLYDEGTNDDKEMQCIFRSDGRCPVIISIRQKGEEVGFNYDPSISRLLGEIGIQPEWEVFVANESGSLCNKTRSRSDSFKDLA